jgi:D-tyrosyl-tRNA(Tyr) deacylase
MIALIQRVSRARVVVADEGVTGSIGPGFCVFLCVIDGDTEEQSDWLADKVSKVRLFPDESGRFDVALKESGGSMLVVSQFTLAGDARKGNRPSFIRAARPEQAIPLIARFATRVRESHGIIVEEGRFGASMRVHIENDGPVTLQIDTDS